MLEEVGQETKVGEPLKDTPLVGYLPQVKKFHKPAPTTSNGYFSKYKIRRTTPRPRKKLAGLIDVNGKKKVYVDYEDGTSKIIDDEDQTPVASQSKRNKTSVFHAIADMFLDLVDNRQEFFDDDDDDQLAEDTIEVEENEGGSASSGGSTAGTRKRTSLQKHTQNQNQNQKHKQNQSSKKPTNKIQYPDFAPDRDEEEIEHDYGTAQEDGSDEKGNKQSDDMFTEPDIDLGEPSEEDKFDWKKKFADLDLY